MKQKKQQSAISKTKNSKFINLFGSFFVFIFCLNPILGFSAGDANISIGGATANGSWSFSGSTYTWTPDANSSTINAADISACMLGTGTIGGSGITDASINGVGSVTILSACSGAGSQSGNVTFAASITAATTTSSQLTLTFTIAGTYAQGAQSVTLTPASNAGTGYPASHMVITAGGNIDPAGAINLIGGASTGSATGGSGGDLTLNSTGGTISMSAYTVSNYGAPGGTGGGTGTCIGGAGGDVTYTGTSVAIDGAVNSYGGAGATGSNGGAGGNFSATATSTTIPFTYGISNYGGAGGADVAEAAAGGAGGSITATAATNITMGSTLNNYGGAGNNGIGVGGAGGAITLTATAGSYSQTFPMNTYGGAAGTSSVNVNGGTGGAISITSGTTLAMGGVITASGGTKYGSGTSNGGDVTLTSGSGLNTTNGITSSGTTAGGKLTLSNITTTIGGANAGQSGAVYTVGSFEKLGAGNFSIGFGVNVWTGVTTLTAGTLTLQSSGTALPDGSQVNFNGGDLNVPYTETIGTIDVSDRSHIILETGNHTLNYAASNAVSWTAGKILVVDDWLGGYNGTAAGGSDPKFDCTTASAELDAGHLAQIVFYRASNTSGYTATQLGTGEIVPTSTLPVELLIFDEMVKTESNLLYWSTGSETNSDYFELTRSQDGTNFEVIGKVKAAGDSESLLKYSFEDFTRKIGLNYYRLHEYDFDGSTQKSDIIVLNNFNKSNNKISPYPNPLDNFGIINVFSEKETICEIFIFSTGGKRVFNTKRAMVEGDNNIKLNLQFLARGTYYLKLVTEKSTLASTPWVKL